MKFTTMTFEEARRTLELWLGILKTCQTNAERASEIPHAEEMVKAARDRMEELQPGSSV